MSETLENPKKEENAEKTTGQRYVVFDTETTGIFDFRKPADDPEQPRLAQFAGIVTDENLKITEKINHYVRPDGWEMTEGAGKVNGLTTEFLKENGEPIDVIFNRYHRFIDEKYILVAYNAQFDLKMMRGELRRANLADRFKETANICVMRAAKVDMEFGGRFFPKLSRACEHYGINLENAHEAGADAMAAYEIFVKLYSKGALPEPKVYYAKNKPE